MTVGPGRNAHAAGDRNVGGDADGRRAIAVGGSERDLPPPPPPLVELDADGDLVYETSNVRPWSNLVH